MIFWLASGVHLEEVVAILLCVQTFHVYYYYVIIVTITFEFWTSHLFPPKNVPIRGCYFLVQEGCVHNYSSYIFIQLMLLRNNCVSSFVRMDSCSNVGVTLSDNCRYFSFLDWHNLRSECFFFQLSILFLKTFFFLVTLPTNAARRNPLRSTDLQGFLGKFQTFFYQTIIVMVTRNYLFLLAQFLER